MEQVKSRKSPTNHRKGQKYLRSLRVKNKKRWERTIITQGEL